VKVALAPPEPTGWGLARERRGVSIAKLDSELRDDSLQEEFSGQSTCRDGVPFGGD
jgi:hypothetical protein